MNQKNAEKIIFLTSSPDASYQVDGEWVTGPFTSKNGFLNQFRQACPKRPRVLLITATPDDTEKNQEMTGYFTRVFAASAIAVKVMRLLERTTVNHLAEWLIDSDVVILGGGHVPTQNLFFRQMKLRERLQDFGGVILGISAGSMNCAEEVYAQPELAGESLDPKYERFLKGLGLTQMQVLPHYQMGKDYMLDGRRLMEEITYPDSVGHKFYALEDGSYILCAGESEVLYGNGYLIADGKITKVCGEGESFNITDG